MTYHASNHQVLAQPKFWVEPEPHYQSPYQENCREQSDDDSGDDNGVFPVRQRFYGHDSWQREAQTTL
jgi:hypothetical protein